jgi:hypothetical protein
MRFGGGADRLSSRTGDQPSKVFGQLANMGSEDVQIAPPAAGMPRRVLLGFHPDAKQSRWVHRRLLRQLTGRGPSL